MSANLSVFVGLDYHSKSVQVCVLDNDGKMLMNRSCDNHWRVIQQAVATAAPNATRVSAAIEACTGAADLAEELVAQAGWSLDQAHPGYVARIKQSPDKTDFSDARLLADLTRVGYLPKVWLAPLAIRELRRLVRYRQQLVNQRRNVRLRIRALLRECRTECTANAWTKAWLSWLETCDTLPEQTRWIMDEHLADLQRLDGQIDRVEQRLQTATADDVVVKQLMSFKGIGLITAATLRAEIGRFDRFRTGKQLSRFCGLTPKNASSGQRQADAGLIKAGNPQLRTVLIEAAQRLKRWEPRWSQLALSMKQRGKPANVVTAAVGNRFVRWLFHQVSPQTAA